MKYLLLTLLVCIAWYLFGAFIGAELNPMLWEEVSRLTLVFLWISTCTMGVVVWFERMED